MTLQWMHTLITLPRHVTVGMAMYASGALASGVGILWMIPYGRGHWQQSARVYLHSFLAGLVCWIAWMMLLDQTHSLDAMWWQRFATIAEIPYALAIWHAQYAVYRIRVPRWVPFLTWGSWGLFVFAWTPLAWWGQRAIENPDHWLTLTAGMTGIAWSMAGLAHLTYFLDLISFTVFAPRILRHDPFRRRLYPMIGLLSLVFYSTDHVVGYFIPLAWYSASAFIGMCWVAIVLVEFQWQLAQDQRTLAVDTLTGCHTRSYGLWRLQEALTTTAVGLLYVDADHFKSVNDTYGHATGDQVLQEIGRALRQALRKHSDWVIRVGGDEFIMVVPDVTEAEWHQMVPLIEGRLGPLTIPLTDDHPVLQQTLSLGPAWAPVHSDPEALLSQGDQAMYAAKHQHHAAEPQYEQLPLLPPQ